MKISTSAILSLAVTAATTLSTFNVEASSHSIRGNTAAARMLLSKARRVEDQGNNNNNNNANANGYYNYNWNNNNNNNNNDEQGNNEEALAYLGAYSLKLLTCLQGEQIVHYSSEDNQEEQYVEGSTVIFRLCPMNSCNDYDTFGCESGYGDYAVGINTFVQAYLLSEQGWAQNAGDANDGNDGNGNYEQQAQGYNYYQYQYPENQQGQDNNQQYGGNANGYYYMNEEAAQQAKENADEFYQISFGQCQPWEDENAKYNYNPYDYDNMYFNYDASDSYWTNGGQLYIGPTCKGDGSDIRLGLYKDEACRYQYEKNAYLPYGNGGLAPQTCVPCSSQQGDGGEQNQLESLCLYTVPSSPSRCEKNMAYVNQYTGANSNGCDYTSSITDSLFADTFGFENPSDYRSNGNSTLGGMIRDHQVTDTEWEIILGVTGVVLGMCLVCCVVGQKAVKHQETKRAAASAGMMSDSRAAESSVPVTRKQSVKDIVQTAVTGTSLMANQAASKVASIVRGDSKKTKATAEIESDYVDVGDSN